MKDLKASSLETRDIALLVQQSKIEKIKPGLYRLTNIPEVDGISISYIDVCQAIPNGVICLLSALEFYDLTTFNPSEIFVALPHSAKPPKMDYPPIRAFYFRERFYNCDIEEKKVASGVVRFYNREKSICDVFRYRTKLGEDVALEALKNYLRLQESNIHRLQEYAIKCHVKSIILPYIKAIIAT